MTVRNRKFYIAAYITKREQDMIEALQEHFGTNEAKLSRTLVLRIAIAELYKAKLMPLQEEITV